MDEIWFRFDYGSECTIWFALARRCHLAASHCFFWHASSDLITFKKYQESTFAPNCVGEVIAVEFVRENTGHLSLRIAEVPCSLRRKCTARFPPHREKSYGHFVSFLFIVSFTGRTQPPSRFKQQLPSLTLHQNGKLILHCCFVDCCGSGNDSDRGALGWRRSYLVDRR